KYAVTHAPRARSWRLAASHCLGLMCLYRFKAAGSLASSSRPTIVSAGNVHEWVGVNPHRAACTQLRGSTSGVVGTFNGGDARCGRRTQRPTLAADAPLYPPAWRSCLTCRHNPPWHAPVRSGGRTAAMAWLRQLLFSTFRGVENYPRRFPCELSGRTVPRLTC